LITAEPQAIISEGNAWKKFRGGRAAATSVGLRPPSVAAARPPFRVHNKGDISNELTKGTLLKSCNTHLSNALLKT